MFFLLLFILQATAEVKEEPKTYRWIIPILEDDAAHSDMCKLPNGTYEKHTFNITQEAFESIQRENKFKEIELDDKQKLTYLLGINGIRNKIAMDWKLSNMNRLHWDPLLEKLSRKFLWKCQLTLDSCNFIGKDKDKHVTISQNMVLFDKSDMEDENIYGYAIRKWYSEFVKKESSFEEFESNIKRKIKGIGNFTNMIWPTAELMGCASAQ